MNHPGLFEEHPAVDRLAARARGRVLDVAVDGLEGEPASFDTILTVRQLCQVGDLDATLRRVDELLAPGGQLLALEHVRGTGLRARMQDASTPIWRHMASGCRADRDLIGALRRNGFAVTDCDRFMMQRAFPIVAPHVSLVAIRKARPTAAADKGDS